MNYVEKVSKSLDTLEDTLAFLVRDELKPLVLLKMLQKLSSECDNLEVQLRCLRDTLSNSTTTTLCSCGSSCCCC